jgi:hypothetical protein
MYPYDFKPRRSGINHQEIFAVMPFDAKYDSIFTNLIQPATEKANDILDFHADNLKLSAYRTKDDLRTTSGWLNVLEHLVSAQIVMGVLTSSNPNVFYELGVAHATQSIARQVLIANQNYKPTFDTKDLIFFKYNEKNLEGSIDHLALKISDAIKTYKIEHEKKVQQARMMIGPYDLEVIEIYGGVTNFAIYTKDDLWRSNYEKQFGTGSFERHVIGITNLCIMGLLGLNTLTRPTTSGIRFEFSYWWTTLGNDALQFMGIISQEDAKIRRSGLPDFF